MTEEMHYVEASFEVKGLGSKDGEFLVESFSGREQIGSLFDFRIIVTTREDIPFGKVLGRKATLTLRRKDAKGGMTAERYVHGIVGAFERIRREPMLGYTVYGAVLVPSAARLGERTTSRIFQDKNTKEIVDEVFGEWSTEGKNHVFAVSPDPVARDYCVQYEESDWHFVSRLLEEEGYYYFFDHGKSDHALSIINAKSYQSPIDDASGGKGKVPFFPRTGQSPAVEHIFSLSFGATVAAGQVVLDEYSFHMPAHELRSSKKAVCDTSFKDHMTVDERLEHYSYPSIFEPAEDALSKSDKLIEETAKIRLEEERSEILVGSGESSCVRFAPGRTFTLSEERSTLTELSRVESAFDGKEYLLTEVYHEGTGGEGDRGSLGDATRCTYSNSFTCVPRDIPFRLRRKTKKPYLGGVQTAKVVGPKGEEIYVDKLGRVKVLFRWDRAGRKKEKASESLERASCWIRVSQLIAGAGWGAMWIPRVGHEVIVSFEEGDPDRPIITGRVYNATNIPPLTLPGEMTKSTIKSDSSPDDSGRRSNEIRFEDKKGSEQIYMHAQLDLDEVVGHDHTAQIKHDEAITIQEGDRRLSVDAGSQTIYVGKDETEIFKGNHKVSVLEGDRSIEVEKGGQVVTIAKSSKETVKGDKEVTVSGKVKITATGGITLESGAASIELTPAGEVKLTGAVGTITIDASGVSAKTALVVNIVGLTTKITGMEVDLN